MFTFLFTDIVGSTALWEQRADEMRIALERHDAVLRSAVEAAPGRVIKTTGDGMLAVFDDANAALSATVAAQRALRSEHPDATRRHGVRNDRPLLRVRMGLHTGEADVRDGDYWGTSVNRAARIMSVAQGEQILLSGATALRVRQALPPEVGLRDLGQHRLKGLADAEHLLQVVAPGLRTDFPPLVTETAFSLPAERDAFVGRRDVLAELERRFAAGARLVSVLGMGGAGKTRLVTRFGWNALASYAGGVCFCDLAQARGVDGIVHAVAQGLDVPLGKDDPIVQLAHAIAARGECLVILDNFEQVVRDAEPTLGRWLRFAPSARFLVTTREVLGLPGEETLPLAPLRADDGAELFVRRAEAVKPDSLADAEDAAAIAPLVRLLDGLPLAIELAAARVRVMRPRALLARMTERFRLLATVGGRVDRQATLRAVLDWSWDLLSLAEKAALAQLSVFDGGFTLDAVEQVLDLSAFPDAPWSLDALQSLVQKSLVRPLGDDRFDLLVTVQEYAAEHLRTESRYAGSGPAARLAAEARHMRYFTSLDERAATADDCAERDNLISACRRAAAQGDAELATRALELAWAALKLRGPFVVAVDLAARVQGAQSDSGPQAARVHRISGEALQLCGKIADARARLESALVSARTSGDRTCEGRARMQLGLLVAQEGKAEGARDHLEEAFAIAQALGDRVLQASAGNGLGQLNAMAGHPNDARRHYERALQLAREAGARGVEGAVMANLAILCGSTGPAQEARSNSEAALAIARETGARAVEGNMLCHVGLLQLLDGDLDEAESSLAAALAVARDIGNAGLEVVVLCNLGMAHERMDHLDRARHDLERGLAIARELGRKRPEGQVLGYLGLVHARNGAFDDARACIDTADALLEAAADLESLGIVRAIRALAEQMAGRTDEARSALAAAERIAADVSPGSASELGNALARARAALPRG
jgi:predicted ATPase/class 3 adenylate cyclase/Tfp pilus assembly protein PilF